MRKIVWLAWYWLAQYPFMIKVYFANPLIDFTEARRLANNRAIIRYNRRSQEDVHSLSKIIAFDIEATGLKADFAYLLSAAFGDVNEDKITVHTLPEGKLANEGRLVRVVAERIQEADVLVSYYGKGYDIPFLNAKMLEYDLPVLPNIPHVDLYFTVKHTLAISRKSLANIAYFTRAKSSKTAVEGRLWKAAMIGDKKALAEIARHNIADVQVLKEVYNKLRPLVRQHPRVNGYGPCRTCGSEKLQRRGIAITQLKSQRQRVQCQKCGSWDLRSM
jgi:uncharacterized protein YprB with RNaseH-like and TPR domain